MIYPRLINGCVIEVLSTKERYLVHWFTTSKTYEFKHIESHKIPSKTLENCHNDKIKTEEEVAKLIQHNVIKTVSIPSYLLEIWNKN